MSLQQAEMGFSAIRLQISALQTISHRTIMNILKSDEISKEIMISFFLSVLKFNKIRTRSRFNRMEASTNGFLLNIDAILLKICEPFTSGQSNKANSVKIVTLIVS